MQSMAGNDIAMNAFTSATDAAYVYAEAANGSQVKIKKSDLFSSVLSGNLNYPNGDINELKNNGIYYVGSNPTAKAVGITFLGVFAAPPAVMQIGYDSNYEEDTAAITLKVRFVLRGNDASYSTWSKWRSISLT
nr:MAG TPA: hypothetical protein [Caudoviricetes sp.]